MLLKFPIVALVEPICSKLSSHAPKYIRSLLRAAFFTDLKSTTGLTSNLEQIEPVYGY